MQQTSEIGDNLDYNNQRYHTLISPRGARGRLTTKRQQFEEIIQAEKDKNQSILNSLVKPHGK